MRGDILQMSTKELHRIEIIHKVIEKQLGQKEAAQLLKRSVRQVKRMCHRFREQGDQGLLSQKRGKPSNHQLSAEIKEETKHLLKNKYADFGPTLAQEKLQEQHRLVLSVETVRQMMIEEDLWNAKRARKRDYHPLRSRRASVGELVQIDGSPHAWFEDRGPECVLLVFIDDATGQLMELEFVPSETMWAYFGVMRRYLQTYGKPETFYSDRDSIFRINRPDALGGTGLTQCGRALLELNIELMCAGSPQAKGRVERANQTLQDRLVKELRLRGISTMQEANLYLPEFRQSFNAKFAVEARSGKDVHRTLLPQDDLAKIFTIQETRTLSKELVVSYGNVLYQVRTPRPSYALRHAQVLVREDMHGNITLEYQGHELEYSVVERRPKQAEVRSGKDIATRMPRRITIPAPTHPWRRTYKHPIPALVAAVLP